MRRTNPLCATPAFVSVGCHRIPEAVVTALVLDLESILSSEERDCMRHTLSRAFTLASTGRPARAARAADQPQPLGTIVVPGGHTQPIPFGVEFKKGESYRIVASGSVTHRFYDYPNHDPTQPAVYSGSVTFDPLFCYAGDGYIGYGLSCSPPVSAQANYGNNVLHDQVSVGGQVHDQVLIGGIWPTFLPRPSYDQGNTYTLAWTPQADSTLAFYDGWMDSSNNAGYSVSAGAWTIKIYGPDTETVKFAASLHHRAHARHAFEVTNALGVGQVVVPTPKEGEHKVKSTSAKGTIKFHKLKVSTKGVLLLDETSLTLRVKSAVFFPDVGGAPLLHINVVVTKSAGTDACPEGSPGTVALIDGEPTGEGDAFGIHIPACKLTEEFHGKPGGGAGKAGFVTVAITVVKP
jgi:hypothetical protein